MAFPQPSLPELKAWEANPVTQWIIAQVTRQFPPPQALLPISNHEAALMVNYRSGSQAVLDRITKLCDKQ